MEADGALGQKEWKLNMKKKSNQHGRELISYNAEKKPLLSFYLKM